jgi:predicted ATP-dependent serine protease
LAISVTKDLNKLGHLVNYYNGEAEKSQFRTWCGTDVNPDLFMVSHVDAIELGQIVNDAYRFKPRVIFIDSLQMVAGADTQRGMMAILSRFKLLKNDPDAGKPHIVMISQLNKKGEMVGSRKIPHMVDFVGKAAKLEAQQGVFVFECPDKNRGGETGRGAIFKHLPNGIECLSKDHRRGPTWKLSQISSLAAQGQQLEEDDQDGPRPVGTGLAGA